MGQITKIDVDGNVSIVDEDAYLLKKDPRKLKGIRAIWQKYKARQSEIVNLSKDIRGQISQLERAMKSYNSDIQRRDYPETLIQQLNTVIIDVSKEQ